MQALAPRLRAASDDVEAARSLPEPLVQALADAGLYRMYLPRSLGGGELDPLTYFDVIEALARVESAAGWSVLISTGAMTITCRGLRDETLRAMFTSPRATIMAGSGPPKGRAVAAPGELGELRIPQLQMSVHIDDGVHPGDSGLIIRGTVDAKAGLDLTFDDVTSSLVFAVGSVSDIQIAFLKKNVNANETSLVAVLNFLLPQLLPAQRYYLGLQNTNTVPVTYVLEVDFDITTLTNAVPVPALSDAIFIPRYYQFDVSTNASGLIFALTNLSGNVDLALRRG